jgi:heme/copper-type cytochrome/quinol oxidase subunit 4
MKTSICKIGYWSGIVAFIAAMAFVIVQTLQLFRVLTYPWDEISIYGFSLCIVIPFLLQMLAFHYSTAKEKQFWSHAALIFTTLYVAFVTANYIVQLATVIPARLAGEVDKIALLVQTPHSLFWDFDAIGYIFMGLATLIAVPIFRKEGFQKWVRYTFLVHGVITTPLITFVYFYPTFSERLLLIGFPWGITAPLCMLMLALLFRRKMKLVNIAGMHE